MSVHRLTDIQKIGDRMVTMGQELGLTQGPSREALFDSPRLGSDARELRVLEFWGEKLSEDGSKIGGSLPVEIEGLHKAGDNGREWFFWGQLKQITSGSTWVPKWEAKSVCFVFGKWNTYHRTGKITFAETSFFQNPLNK